MIIHCNVACCSVKLSHSDFPFRLSIAQANLQLSAACQCWCHLLLCVTEQPFCQCCQGKHQRANSYSSAEAAAWHGHCVGPAAGSGGAYAITGERRGACKPRSLRLSHRLLIFPPPYIWMEKKQRHTLHLLSFRNLCSEMYNNLHDNVLNLIDFFIFLLNLQSRPSSPRLEDSLPVAQKVHIF